MMRAIFAIVVEVLAVGALCVFLRWANKLLDEQLAGAEPAPETTRKAQVFCAGCRLVHEPPLHPPRWPVVLCSPCERGYIVQQFEVVGELSAAHVALYRVPRFGNEARA